MKSQTHRKTLKQCMHITYCALYSRLNRNSANPR